MEDLKPAPNNFDHCDWMYDDHHFAWATMCGEMHQFTHEGPRENKHFFCPYCGKCIEVLAATTSEFSDLIDDTDS